MSEMTLNAGVRRLIVGALTTVPHLEALLLLRAQPRAWGDEEVASRLYVSRDRAAAVLADLESSGLLTRASNGYAYGPADAETARLVADLADAYARHVVEITRLIHSRTDRAAQQFADAFLIRKGDRP